MSANSMAIMPITTMISTIALTFTVVVHAIAGTVEVALTRTIHIVQKRT